MQNWIEEVDVSFNLGRGKTALEEKNFEFENF